MSTTSILVGIDYTQSSGLALWQAHCLAQELRADLHAVHVISHVEYEEFDHHDVADNQALVAAAQTSLESFLSDTLGPDHNATGEVLEGSPHHELVLLAHEREADLIVVGVDESTDRPRRAGRFAICCLRFSEIPVLIVRNQPQRPFSHLTACVDFSGSTQPVLENLAWLDFDRDQRVALCHAYCPPWLHPRAFSFLDSSAFSEQEREQYKEKVQTRLHELREQLKNSLMSTVDLILLEDTDPIKALLEHLDDSHTEVVVIGRTGRGLKGIKTDLLGGTAEALIRHAQCSVLVVPLLGHETK